MENLPLEVLRKVMSYLDVPQLLEASLVCKRWFHVSGTLLEDISLQVSLNLAPTFFPDVACLMRTYVRLNFYEMTINDLCIDFLKHFEVCHLKFEGCMVHESCTSIIKCDKLLTLETNTAPVLSLFDSLPSLETLNLTSAMDVSQEILRRAQFLGPYLKSFCMSPMEIIEEVDTNLTSAAIEEFVSSRAETLKFLELPFYISSEVLLNISKVKNLKLESVILSYGNECSSVIVEFCANQPSIKTLELDHVMNLSDTIVSDIFAHSPALREFSADYCDGINQCIVPMFARPNMRRINLHFCREISPHSFSTAISSLACVNLRALNLGRTQLQETHVRALLPLVPGLDELDLSHCPLSDNGFREATLRLTRLRKLKLDECRGLTGRTLGHLSGLLELSLRFCDDITREGLLEGARFQHLKKLDLYGSLVSSPFVKYELKEQNPCLIL